MTQPIITNQFRLIPRDGEFLDRKFGSRGEVYYDRDTNTLRLYDGDTQSGVSLAKNDLSNVSNSDFSTKLDAVGGGNQIPYETNEDLTWAAGEYDFGNNIIKYANAIQLEEDLSNYSPATYHGMTMHVHETGALYYAHAGEWRKLITDTSYNDAVGAGYTDPLSAVAYSGSYDDLLNLPDLSGISNTTVVAGAGISVVDDSSGTFTVANTENSFANIAVSGEDTITAAQLSDTLTLIGDNITITTDGESNTVTLSAQPTTQAFNTIAVSGQSNVVADQAEDTLQLVAGPNISITTSPGSDSITISATTEGGEASGVSTGQADRLARYASTGQVVQDTGENLTFDGTTLILNGSPVVTRSTETKTEIFVGADDSTLRTVTDQESILFLGGTGIDTTSDAEGNITITNSQNCFSTIAITGQDNVVADAVGDTFTLVAGTNVTLTTDADNDRITISAASTASNSFETISVSGESDVVAASSADTLTLVAGTGIDITTDAGSDSITITNSGSSPNLFATVDADSGSTTANSTTDTLTIAGGTGISTSILGDTVTISSSAASDFTDLGDVTTASLRVDKIYLQAITRLVVNNVGASAYTFDQYGATNNPTIFAISGTTIAFDLDAIGGHPFLIQDGAASNYSTGLVHVSTTGTVSTGSSAQGQQSGTLYWKVPSSISGNYRYQCSIHGSMVGAITIKAFSSI